MERRPTQLDIAKALGIHRTTVSLVFKNHPSIPESTRKRVLECAKAMGYAPDPMLSSLAAYRSGIRPKAFQGTIAWLANPTEGPSWDTIPAFRAYHAGAAACAQTHGFKLETFDLQQNGISNDRLASIFRARNISGILLPPQSRPKLEINFAWEEFSTVTFGYSLLKPQFHTITAAQFRAMVQTMRKLKELGYKRIGFYFTASHDERTDHNYLAGYLVETFSASSPIPPLFCPEGDSALFLPWYEKYRPDAIVTGVRDILKFLGSLKIQVPEELGVASPLLERELLERKPQLAGVYEDSFHIGEIAVDFLVSMLHRGERGIPQCPQRVLMEGAWVEGDTLRAQDAVEISSVTRKKARPRGSARKSKPLA